MRVVVTGGAGFLGSHLCEALLRRGDRVECLDNLSTGRRANIEHLLAYPGFGFIQTDVCDPFDLHDPIHDGPIDAVAHLASPASPPDYHRMPLQTLAVGSRGTENALDLARRSGARFLLASTSEVYGDPLVHPQRESYWGNVNSVGPRSVYDEAKRYAEAVTMAYSRSLGLNTGIVRIFNTYGPRMRPEDGRVVSSFITQALLGEPLTVYGDGGQTRSFCYVDDLVRGLVAMLDHTHPGPINLGNPYEHTMLELARFVAELTATPPSIEFHPLPEDDPTRRRPDITLARQVLGWAPVVDVADGLRLTLEDFAARPDELVAAGRLLRGPQFEGTAAVNGTAAVDDISRPVPVDVRHAGHERVDAA